MRKALLALSLLLIAAAAAGSVPDPFQHRGFEKDKVYAVGDIDSVNVFNGNLMIRVPIGPAYTVGPSLQYQLVLTYNGKIWDYVADFQPNPPGQEPQVYPLRISLPERQSNAGLGWSLSLGRLIPPSDPLSLSPEHGWIYVAPDGSEHVVSDQGTEPSEDRSKDGSYLRLKRTPPNTHWPLEPPTPPVEYWEIEFPDGLVRKFDPDGKLTEIRDRFGNWVRVNYAEWQWIIIDGFGSQAGRTHHVNFLPGSGDQANFQTLVHSVELDGVKNGSAPAYYTFSYAQNTQVGRGGDSQRWYGQPTACIAVPLLQTLTLPDGTSYSAEYNLPPLPEPGQVPICDRNTIADTSSAPVDSGFIRSLTLPTKGKLVWTAGSYFSNLQQCRGPVQIDAQPHPSPYRTRPYRVSYVGVKTRKMVDVGQTEAQAPTWIYATYALEASYNGKCDPKEEFDYEFFAAQELINRVEAPDGLVTVSHFSVAPEDLEYETLFKWQEHGLPLTHNSVDAGNSLRLLSTEVFDCSTGCTRNATTGVPTVTPTRRTFVTYESEPDYPNPGKNARVKGERTRFFDDVDGSSWSCNGDVCYVDVERSSFDDYGHYRTSVSTSNFPGSVSRIATTNYTPDATNWLLELYDQSSVTENGTTNTTLTRFNAVTGAIESVRKFRGATASAQDLMTVLCRSGAAGTRGFVTSERSLGGDLAPLTTDSMSTLCSSSRARANGEYYLDHTFAFAPAKPSLVIGRNSRYDGVPDTVRDEGFEPERTLLLTARDASGVTSSYTYDNMSRLKSQNPAGRAVTFFEYDSTGAKVSARMTQCPKGAANPCASPLTESRYYYDGFGRLIQSEQKLPTDSTLGGPSWGQSWLQYDPSGRVVFASLTVGAPSAGVVPLPAGTRGRAATFDIFGRAKTSTTPDGAVTSFVYNGTRVIERSTRVATGFTAQQLVTTRENYDANGRLQSVTEDVGGLDLLTSYQYDAGGQLTQVLAGSQARSFVYDGAGLLQSETHPESGLTRYLTFDAKGHALQKRTADCKFDLDFAYDPAERLTRVAGVYSYWDCTTSPPGQPEPPGIVRTPLKEFEYESVMATGDSGFGKLRNALRYNRNDLGNIKVTETFTYGDPAGRATKKETEIRKLDQTPQIPPPQPAPVLTGTIVQEFVQEFTYDDLDGEIESFAPYCAYRSCGAGTHDGALRVFDQGALKQIQAAKSINGSLFAFDDVASLNYHPNGSRKSIAHGDGTGDETQLDTSDRIATLVFNGLTDCVTPSVAISGTLSVPYGSGTSLAAAVSFPGDYQTPVTYQWYASNSPALDKKLGGQTEATLTISAVTSSVNYWVVVQTTCTLVTSSAVTVSVVDDVSAPTGLQANRVGSTTSIQVTWNAVSNAAAYAVERRTAGDAAFYEITTSSRPTGASYTDSGCPSGNVCVYRVRAVSVGGTISNESNRDLAGLLTFSVLAGGTVIDLDHFNELLNAVSQVRAASGQTSVAWSGILPGGVPVPAVGGVIRAAHLTSLRDAMDAARSLAGIPNGAYTDTSLTGVPIRGLHLTELQERTK